jgi:hypothetical protein
VMLVLVVAVTLRAGGLRNSTGATLCTGEGTEIAATINVTINPATTKRM